MTKSDVRKLFTFFIIFLLFQYALVGVIGVYKSEPWPAFVFPGFKSIYVYEDGYEFSSTIFELYEEDKDEAISLKPHVFLPEVPISQLSGFLRTSFYSEEKEISFSNETKDWLMAQAAKFTDGPVTDVQVVWQQNFYSKSDRDTKVDSTIEYKRFSLVSGYIEGE
ncbi:hypothetical protein [Rhodohalobacter sp. 614A]|uniref:hypothetical protein n=1 Tax=Rhodohalobacter sp. 614A TaxID=2908649 RepID=UPI001F371C1B|nr:hypothetical protein [Rhodohalobacter sp. 614A]